MIRIDSIKFPVNASSEEQDLKICRFLKVERGELVRTVLIRRSLDARRGHEPQYVCTVEVQLGNEAAYLKRRRLPEGVKKAPEKPVLRVPYLGEKTDDRKPPVVVGFGPAGMFAALYLARCGLKPIVIERGEPVEERAAKVDSFWKTRVLDPKSNVQFGEGGAGTFSDGKLNTLIKDKEGYGRHILEEMVRHGAPEEILYEAKPHIGTDRLQPMVRSIREEIISLGGEVLFSTRFIEPLTKDGRLCGLSVEKDGTVRTLETDALFLGIGHSARDTFLHLRQMDLPMEAKAFAMGVRIEHLQRWINEARYHEYAASLGAADYKVTHTASNGHGVYSFCMCPGGVVVNSSSEEGRLTTNGMSLYARDGENANSALIVTVTPEDTVGFAPQDPVLSGLYFQRDLEEKAFLLGGSGYKAPVQRVEDFHLKRPSSGIGEVRPTITTGYVPENLWEILPAFMAQALDEGLQAFDRKIHSFDHPDAILTGIEARTSSPVRILRDPVTMMSRLSGLYPIGEGAGYAGGIMSAAIDGLKAAARYAAELENGNGLTA